MVFIVSMIYAIIFIYIFRNKFKKNPVLFYIAAILIGLLTTVSYIMKIYEKMPLSVFRYTFGTFSRGSFATALFVIVMYTGCFSKKNKLGNFLYKIRDNLSIIASILTLFHNFLFGIFYFVMLFTGSDELKGAIFYAAIVSIILIVIMLPLMITSFNRVRNKMKKIVWINIQKFAYAFYGFLYIHLMLLFIPKYINEGENLLDIIVYTIVFGVYVIMRLRKYFIDRKHKLMT